MLKLLIMIVAGLAFLGFMFLAFFLNIQSEGVGFNGSQFPWTSYALTCLAMVIGIYFASLYRNLAGRDGQVNILQESLLALTAATFWRAICVSPLVFMALYKASGDVPGDLPSLLLAFQNGFFWENVLKKGA
jgi:hypothetical protein